MVLSLDEEGLVHPRVVEVVAHRGDQGGQCLEGRQVLPDLLKTVKN